MLDMVGVGQLGQSARGHGADNWFVRYHSRWTFPYGSLVVGSITAGQRSTEGRGLLHLRSIKTRFDLLG